jgi:hypothetical protein
MTSHTSKRSNQYTMFYGMAALTLSGYSLYKILKKKDQTLQQNVSRDCVDITPSNENMSRQEVDDFNNDQLAVNMAISFGLLPVGMIFDAAPNNVDITPTFNIITTAALSFPMALTAFDLMRGKKYDPQIYAKAAAVCATATAASLVLSLRS